MSLLELETQAEVDKYAVTVFLLADQQGGGYPAQVHARLFDRVSFDARLEPDQYDRYRTAHRCAAHYCRRLEHRFVSRGEARIEAMVRELRRFYRLGSTRQIASRAGVNRRLGAARSRYSSSSLLPAACFFSFRNSLSLRRSFLRGAGGLPSLPLSYGS